MQSTGSPGLIHPEVDESHGFPWFSGCGTHPAYDLDRISPLLEATNRPVRIWSSDPKLALEYSETMQQILARLLTEHVMRWGLIKRSVKHGNV